MHGAPVPIGSRAFEIVHKLVASAGQFVTKDELMAHVWPGIVVGENTLRVHISAIRKAFGSDRTMLKTAAGRGYLLLGGWMVGQESTRARHVDLADELERDQTPEGNLPAALSDLIGRGAAAQQLSDLLSAYRVVTLTGPGGIGKTTLAIKVARDCLTEFDDGRWLVELASLSDPELVPSTVASVLGLKLGGEMISSDAVARAIGGKKLLLVLDNCEHVVEAAASQIAAIVRQCPRTTVLATSREVLSIDGERVYRLSPLEIPASNCEEPEQLLQRTAVKLFIARTQALDTDFSPGVDNYSAIAAICQHLDGIPLAIEFAAARVATLGVHQVAAALTDRFALLTSRRRTTLPRHQTLRATLDWSYQLLPEAERLLLHYLSVFAGGFTIEAVTAIVDEGDRSPVMDGISNLVSKSLVMLDDAASETRWRLLETIRAYALDKLEKSGEAERISRRHAEYFCTLFAPAGNDLLLRSVSIDVPRSIHEIDNVRSALDWSFSPPGDTTLGISLTAAYTSVWLRFALLTECRERCEQALSATEPDAKSNTHPHMRLQNALGSALIATLGPTEEAKSAAIRALEIATIRDDPEAQAQALGTLIPAFLYLLENGEAAYMLANARATMNKGFIVGATLTLAMLGLLLHAGFPDLARRGTRRLLRPLHGRAARNRAAHARPRGGRGPLASA